MKRVSQQFHLSWLSLYIMEQVFPKTKYRFNSALVEEAIIEWAVKNGYSDDVEIAIKENSQRLANQRLKV